MPDSQYPDDTWEEILSRRPRRIQRVFAALDVATRLEVLQHLNRMVTEDGWQEVQITSAAIALKTINSSTSSNHA
jgi:hypothetical protein